MQREGQKSGWMEQSKLRFSWISTESITDMLYLYVAAAVEEAVEQTPWLLHLSFKFHYLKNGEKTSSRT